MAVLQDEHILSHLFGIDLQKFPTKDTDFIFELDRETLSFPPLSPASPLLDHPHKLCICRTAEVLKRLASEDLKIVSVKSYTRLSGFGGLYRNPVKRGWKSFFELVPYLLLFGDLMTVVTKDEQDYARFLNHSREVRLAPLSSFPFFSNFCTKQNT